MRKLFWISCYLGLFACSSKEPTVTQDAGTSRDEEEPCKEDCVLISKPKIYPRDSDGIETEPFDKKNANNSMVSSEESPAAQNPPPQSTTDKPPPSTLPEISIYSDSSPMTGKVIFSKSSTFTTWNLASTDPLYKDFQTALYEANESTKTLLLAKSLNSNSYITGIRLDIDPLTLTFSQKIDLLVMPKLQSAPDAMTIENAFAPAISAAKIPDFKGSLIDEGLISFKIRLLTAKGAEDGFIGEKAFECLANHDGKWLILHLSPSGFAWQSVITKTQKPSTFKELNLPITSIEIQNTSRNNLRDYLKSQGKALSTAESSTPILSKDLTFSVRSITVQ